MRPQVESRPAEGRADADGIVGVGQVSDGVFMGREGQGGLRKTPGGQQVERQRDVLAKVKGRAEGHPVVEVRAARQQSGISRIEIVELGGGSKVAAHPEPRFFLGLQKGRPACE